VRFVDDRLQQLARALFKQTQQEPRDSLLVCPPVFNPTVELTNPYLFGSSVVPVGTATDPRAESTIFAEVVDKSGASGIDVHDMIFFSPGVWHLQLHHWESFTGTTNFAASQSLNLQVLTQELGSVLFTMPVFTYRRRTGDNHEVVRELWLPMLGTWKLSRVLAAFVAADEYHAVDTVFARRFI